MDYRENQIAKLEKTELFKNAIANPKGWHVASGSTNVDLAYSMLHFGMVEIDPTTPNKAFAVSIRLNPTYKQ